MADTKQKIVPHLWFDQEAKEAADFYCSILPDSRITALTTLHNTPSGDTDVVSSELLGYQFQAISAGPAFKFNPSISFMVNVDRVTQAFLNMKKFDLEMLQRAYDGE